MAMVMYGVNYLNDDGSRWRPLDASARRAHIVTADGYDRIRIVDYFEAFGNFVGYELRIAGKRYGGLPESFPCEDCGLPRVNAHPRN